MDTYNVQSYFKSLCKSYYIAYEQFKRFENDKQSEDYDFWRNRVNTCQSEIRTVIQRMSLNKIVIIISTKEEVFALVWFYSQYSNNAYEFLKHNIINISEKAKCAYPMSDALCRDFWNAYTVYEYNRSTFIEMLKRWKERWK